MIMQDLMLSLKLKNFLIMTLSPFVVLVSVSDSQSYFITSWSSLGFADPKPHDGFIFI